MHVLCAISRTWGMFIGVSLRAQHLHALLRVHLGRPMRPQVRVMAARCTSRGIVCLDMHGAPFWKSCTCRGASTLQFQLAWSGRTNPLSLWQAGGGRCFSAV